MHGENIFNFVYNLSSFSLRMFHCENKFKPSALVEAINTNLGRGEKAAMPSSVMIDVPVVFQPSFSCQVAPV